MNIHLVPIIKFFPDKNNLISSLYTASKTFGSLRNKQLIKKNSTAKLIQLTNNRNTNLVFKFSRIGS